VKTHLTPILSALTRQRGVTGSLLVDEGDGVIIDATLHVGMKGPAFAALAASLYRKARLSADAAGLGGVTFLRLRAEKGHVCAAGKNELVLVIVADSRANIGLIRQEMLKALEKVAP
jgi:predicted regulator of Ras-like GTPase activity (Roadblock/LC7/MglB family)